MKFDSNYEPAKPHLVIMTLINNAAKENKFTMGNDNPSHPIIAYHKDLAQEIDDYIERLLREGKS